VFGHLVKIPRVPCVTDGGKTLKIEINEAQAKALYEVLMALDDATHPSRVKIDGEPFDGAPFGPNRTALRRVWWKVAKVLGHA
jgi:hypothetical protein